MHRHLIPFALLGAAALVCGLGLYVFFTERGVANEIKGFVLVLLGAVLLVGGLALLELGEIRRRLDER